MKLAFGPKSDRARGRALVAGGALALLLAAGACDEGWNNQPDMGASGGGSAGSGGRGGSGMSAGGSGAGGTSGSGGTTGAGGTTGTGGSATGGTSGSGGTPSGGDAGGDGSPADTYVPPAGYLDQCFMGLRTLGTPSQIASKASSTGAYQVRLALEVPPDTVGTSGTRPWKLVRIAVITPQKTICVKDEAMLAAAYKASHHNCTDSLTVTVDGLNYKVDRPDTDPARADSSLSITGVAAIPPVTLMTKTCTGNNAAACKSGGPCQ